MHTCIYPYTYISIYLHTQVGKVTIPEETLEYFISNAQQAAGSNGDAKGDTGQRVRLLGAEGGPFEVLTSSTGVQVLYVCEYV